jgi:hypothetical protein
MNQHRLRSDRPRRADIVLFLAMAAIAWASPAFAQVPKTDFYGTWAMNHDGWQGQLVLRGAGIPAGLFGDYVGADGKVHFVQGSVEDHKVVLYIDLKDTKGLPDDDQRFEGYLFTQSRNAMAGTTTWGNVHYGWSAVKTSSATKLPPPPVVSTDKPDIEGPDEAVVTASSGEFRLSTTQAEYAPGEAVGFELKNTLSRNVNLAGFYFIIERRDEGVGKEFYTSAKEPFGGLKLKPGDKRLWYWDQWDNERLAKAAPGSWRIKFYAPQERQKPFTVPFKIKNP